MLWCCWLGGRKRFWPVKTECWGAGMVVCLEWGADLHTVQLMPLPLTFSCFSKIQIGFTFLLLAHLGSPRQRAIKWVCVGVCGCVFCYHKDSLFLTSEKCLLSDCSRMALTNGLLYVTLQSLLRSDTLCCVVQRSQSHWCHPRSFPAVTAHVTCTTISATFEPKWPPTRKSVYATFSYRSLTLAGFNLLYFIKVACSKNVL